MDYEIQASDQRCAATGRELKPGEQVYSILLQEGGKFVRKDFGAESWHGPPHGALGFWQGKLRGRMGVRRRVVDDDVLLECFLRLEEELKQDISNFRFVLALLLIRRRRLRLIDTRKEGGRETLLLRCVKSGDCYEVPDPALSDDELESVQDEVFRVLGWE